MSDIGDEFRVLFEYAPDLLYTQDLSGSITRVNRGFERVTALSRGEVIGTDVQALIVPEHRARFRQQLLEKIGGGPPQTFEVDWLTKRGRIPLELSIELIFEEGCPVAVQGFGRDITARQEERARRAAADATMLRQTQQLAKFSRYVQLLHRLSTTVYAQIPGLFEDYLRTGCEIFGVEHGVITDAGHAVLPSGRTSNSLPEFLNAVLEQIGESRATLVQVPGECSQVFYVGAPLVIADQLFGVLAFWSESGADTQAQAREIIEMMARGIESAVYQSRLTARLEHLARHDVLTGLPNRMLLSEQIDSALEEARRTNGGVALLFVDLDQFKEINDTLGHAVGDVVLRQVADRLREAACPECWLARMGGDEFIGVIRGVRNGEDALSTGNRILQTLSRPFLLNGQEVQITASAGVSVYPADGQDGETLLRTADAAMYQAKRRSGNTVQRSSA